MTFAAPSPRVPEIAIIGHPNEGKSSVLSTLAEDDSVRVSATPGETTECRTFPVRIDGREVLRFTDTPGFQNPAKLLSELEKLSRGEGDCIQRFRDSFRDVPELRDDIELLKPVERGAGIIYVVDGSRPVRNVDRYEMEILRLSARPRMAIINCKDDDFTHLENWKNEFRKNFNTNRVFNAHRATYAERILLLEALKSIDQDWQILLDEVVATFKADWAARNIQTVDIILDLLTYCLQYSVTTPVNGEAEIEKVKEHLSVTYHNTISAKEKSAHDRIKRLFKHNIFNYSLPSHSLLHEDLFSERTWHLLGLSKTQIALIGGIGGAAIGAGLDLSAGGMSLGIVTGLSATIGALTALWGGKKLSERGVMGIRLGGEQLRIGPADNINLLFVLINRALLYYKHTINWAHGRRDYDTVISEPGSEAKQQSFTADWNSSKLRACRSFFKAISENKYGELSDMRSKLGEILMASLSDISQHE